MSFLSTPPPSPTPRRLSTFSSATSSTSTCEQHKFPIFIDTSGVQCTNNIGVAVKDAKGKTTTTAKITQSTIMETPPQTPVPKDKSYKKNSQSTEIQETEAMTEEDIREVLVFLRNLLKSYNRSKRHVIARSPLPPTPPPSEFMGGLDEFDCLEVYAKLLNEFLSVYKVGASDPTNVPFELLESLVRLLKELTSELNDREFPDIGHGDQTPGFRFKAAPSQPSLDASIISFKPRGTISLIQSLNPKIIRAISPIIITGTVPTKTHDGSSKGGKMAGVDELQHRYQSARMESSNIMNAAKRVWEDRDIKKRHKLCDELTNTLVLLLLYWAIFLNLERRLALGESDREKVKRACQRQMMLACTDDKGRKMRNGSSLVLLKSEEAVSSPRSQGGNKKNGNVDDNLQSRPRRHSSVNHPSYGVGWSTTESLAAAVTQSNSGQWSRKYEVDEHSEYIFSTRKHRASKSLSDTKSFKLSG